MTPTLSADPAIRRPASPAGALDIVCRWLERFPASLLAIAFRVGVAMVFWKSGLTKIASWDTTLALFADEYPVPLLSPVLAAWLATLVELAGAVMLVLGLGTRLAAAALLGLTVVIQLFVFPENWPEHVLWGSTLGYLLTRGAGVFSADYLISRVWGGRTSAGNG